MVYFLRSSWCFVSRGCISLLLWFSLLGILSVPHMPGAFLVAQTLVPIFPSQEAFPQFPPLLATVTCLCLTLHTLYNYPIHLFPCLSLLHPWIDLVLFSIVSGAYDNIKHTVSMGEIPPVMEWALMKHWPCVRHHPESFINIKLIESSQQAYEGDCEYCGIWT